MEHGLDAVTYRRMEKAIRYLDERQLDQPSLGELAAHVGLSPHHLQRVFRTAVGLSPKRFLQFATSVRARRVLEEEGNLLRASWGAGLSGPGRLHDLMVNVHAMTPAEVRSKGRGVRLLWGVHDSPVGPCVLARSGRGLAVLEFLERGTRSEGRGRVAARWPAATLEEDPGATAPLAGWVFGKRGGEGPLSLHVGGTNFQIRVWEALLAIPEGTVTTYGALAGDLGLSRRAARAVGQAVGANPVAVAIPCHRVLRGTGALGGYRWGEERKLLLLGRELAGD
ncbi:MAG TPA: methylated-DNA--[protein]-cysteine S-methyltransferase [Longimicrobiales bacterium]|nr:methylated-DNA--[protein]-cysteine S-methyltransferase [Longimicrobiales bacterium]